MPVRKITGNMRLIMAANTISNIYPLFLGIEPENYPTVVMLFEFNLNLADLKNKFSKLRSGISELNMMIEDQDRQNALSQLVETSKLETIQETIDGLEAYKSETINLIQASSYDLSKSYKEAFELFMDKFFEELNFSSSNDTPFDQFSRQELIMKIKDIKFQDSILNYFKGINFDQYSTLSLFLFYKTTDVSNLPTNLSEITKKLNTIESFCKKHSPKNTQSLFGINKDESDALNKSLEIINKSLETFNELAGQSTDDITSSLYPHDDKFDRNLTI